MKRRTTIKNARCINRKTLTEAEGLFLQHCRIRNLNKSTLSYYEEDIGYFSKCMPEIVYVDEINRDVVETFLGRELDNGKKVSSLNTRLRGLRVFLRFCAEREYMEPVAVELMKEDDNVKEPYTDTEIERLIKRPASDRWVEWRNWAIVNYLVGTGNRASTVINLRVKDVDFAQMTIFLSTVKNRRQQYIPLSASLKAVLVEYLQTSDFTPDDFLFPSFTGKQLPLRSLQMTIKEYNVSRGVSKSSIHLFRHYFAKSYVLSGGGMVQLQSLLGHSTLEMSRHYVNLYSQDLHKNYDMFNPLNTICARGIK